MSPKKLGLPTIPWKVEEHSIKWDDTVDGRNPANHLGCIKACKSWDNLPTSTG